MDQMPSSNPSMTISRSRAGPGQPCARAMPARPAFFGSRSPRHYRLAVADLKHAAIKIEHVSECPYSLHGHGFAQLIGGSGVKFGHAQIQPAHGWVANEGIYKIAVLFIARRDPILGRVKNRRFSGPVIVSERPVGSQRLFESGNGKTGING